MKLIKDNEDVTKKYAIISSGKVYLSKNLFEILPKQEIVIFELKKSESTLEDAFIKLIDTTSSETVKDKEVSKDKEAEKAKKKENKAKEKEEKAKAKKENKKKGGDK